MALVKKEIGELLVENGLLTPEEWQSVQVERDKTGEPVSLILARLGLATEAHVKNALELQYGVNYLALTKVEKPEQECLEMLPESLMRQHQVVPVGKDGNRVTVAMVNPNNLAAMDAIKVRLKGTQIKTVVCTEDDFQQFMETVYQQHIDVKKEAADDADQSFITDDVDLSSMDLLGDELDDASDMDLENQSRAAPVILLANQILAKAIKNKISDIHVEPQEKELLIRYRSDGVLRCDRKLPKQILPALVSRFKVMADLDIAERRLPQDGRIRVRLSGKDIDFRVSTLPAKFGEKVVMRILDKSNTTLGLDKLISEQEVLDVVRDMIQKPFGMIFVTGPTGSGKTTSLYSALAERNTVDINIVTAEDPIEYDMEGVNQCQVLREKGLDFAKILKAFLRQDPNIMLVGETRDKETAKMSVEAALTGHLVFTTLHTNDAAGAITRLEEMEVDPFLIASATLGIVAQRLLRRICGDCKEEYLPDRQTLEYIGILDKSQEKLAPNMVDYYKMRLNEDGWPIFTRGSGKKGECETCRGTGYKGRVGCYEVLRLNDEIRDLISKHASTALIRFAGKQTGMIPLKDYSIRLVGRGITTIDEVYRVTLSDTGGEDSLCPKCRNPIGDDFLKCPFCQHDLKRTCIRCGTLQQDEWTNCPKCGVSQEQAAMDSKCANCEAKVPGDWVRCPYCQNQRATSAPKNGQGNPAA
jgi:type IV pilus assembly protein PilB